MKTTDDLKTSEVGRLVNRKWEFLRERTYDDKKTYSDRLVLPAFRFIPYAGQIAGGNRTVSVF